MLRQFLAEDFPKTAVMGQHAQQRDQAVEQKTEGAPTDHPQREFPVKEFHAFNPDQRQDKTGEKTDQRPIVCHSHAIDEGKQVQPPFLARDTKLQQTENQKGEDQQIEHLPSP